MQAHQYVILLALHSLFDLIRFSHNAGRWEGSLDSASQDAFIGWKGESYIANPPSATPTIAAPAEPLLPDTSAVTGHAGSDSATVQQVWARS
jgi:hypothetical protein